MKKSALYIVAAFVLITIASCKKLTESVYPGQDITLEELTLSVLPIPFADSTIEFPAGTFTTYVNTDSIIRASTGGVFGINSVSSVRVKQITMQAENADADDNLSAFKSFRIALTSNAESNPANIAQVEIPATAVDSFTSTPTDSPDITPYLHGTSITYTVYGRVRSTTSKTLNISAVVVVTAK